MNLNNLRIFFELEQFIFGHKPLFLYLLGILGQDPLIEIADSFLPFQLVPIAILFVILHEKLKIIPDLWFYE